MPEFNWLGGQMGSFKEPVFDRGGLGIYPAMSNACAVAVYWKH